MTLTSVPFMQSKQTLVGLNLWREAVGLWMWKMAQSGSVKIQRNLQCLYHFSPYIIL